MRIDAIGPRTWLLAAAAAWALLLWLLALFGLGGRIGTLADAAAAAALPQWREPAADRLGPLTGYAGISARPLFSDDRQPRPFFIDGSETDQPAPSSDFVLTSVLIAPSLRMAIVQPDGGGDAVRIRLGETADALPGWRLVDLQPRSATFDGPQGPRTLELRVFDGNGGQAPTVSGGNGNGNAPPVRQAAAKADAPADRPAASAPAQQADAAAARPQAPPTTEEQMQEIRKRIEARRRQLREQGQTPPTPNKTQ